MSGTINSHAGLTEAYSYDQLSRLTAVTASGANQAFAYDAVGNRSSHVRSGSTAHYTTATTSNRLLDTIGASATTYQYDANGNITAGNGASYGFDAFNRLAGSKRTGNHVALITFAPFFALFAAVRLFAPLQAASINLVSNRVSVK